MNDEENPPVKKKLNGYVRNIGIYLAFYFILHIYCHFVKPPLVRNRFDEFLIPLLVLFVGTILFAPIIGVAWYKSDPNLDPKIRDEGLGCGGEFLMIWGFVAICLMGWAWWRWEFPIWVGVPLTLLILFVLGIGVSLLYQGLIRLFSWWRRRK